MFFDIWLYFHNESCAIRDPFLDREYTNDRNRNLRNKSIKRAIYHKNVVVGSRFISEKREPPN